MNQNIDPGSLRVYDYDLPKELISQKPAFPRDTSRLLVLHKSTGKIEHRKFFELSDYLSSGDLVVINNSKVIKARLLGHRLRDEKGKTVKGGRVEFLMLEPTGSDTNTWEGLFRSAIKQRPGLEFEIPTPDGRGLRGVLLTSAAQSPHGSVVAKFDRDPLVAGAGDIPLPPYIRRPPLPKDEDSYQTVYAKDPGSVAAPTAGFHFTKELLEKLKSKGIHVDELTLHVGLGTFRPVQDDDISKHVMHNERYFVPGSLSENVLRIRNNKKSIIAVGTTSVRTLESAWSRENSGLIEGGGRTDLFIRPGEFKFQVVDKLITNFHLPKTTLLMLVCTFAGTANVLAAYKEAVKAKYRFFSYGDAMLII